MDNSRMAIRRRRRRKRILRKLIPTAVAMILIAVIAIVSWKSGLFESFSYSNEEADLYSYYGSIADDYAVMIKDGTITTDQLKVIDGCLYIPYERVLEEYNETYYYDENDKALLYTTATDVISAPLDGRAYIENGVSTPTDYVICTIEKEELLVCLDYVKLHADAYYEIYGGNGEPYRARLINEWNPIRKAPITGDQYIRVGMDKKSKVLRSMSEGDVVTILEEGMDWCKIQTDDLLIGYYESRYLGDITEEAQIAPPAHVEPEIPSISKDYTIRLIWDMVTISDANYGLADRLSGQSGLTTVSPTWFYLTDSEGNIESLGSADYVTKAHNMGLEVWGLIDNMHNLDNVNTYEILSHSEKRAYVISQLMQYASEYGMDGINLDFESISAEAGPSYIQFIRELSIACRKAGLVLSVDNYVPTASTAVYNRDEQGKFVDYLIIMGYDEHYNGSLKSGSVASLNFVIEGITKTLEEVDASKVINAVPLYTRVWTEIPKSDAEIAAEDKTDEFIPYKLDVQTLSMADAIQYVANAGVTATWDEETSQNYAEWKKGEKTVKVWLEDADSLAAKVQAMHSFNLAGIAAWQSGFAGKTAWEAIASY